MKYPITTQSQVRNSFWELWTTNHGSSAKQSLRQNQQPTDVRVAFVDYVDHLRRNGEISEALAQRVTL